MITLEQDVVIRQAIAGVYRANNNKLWRYDESGKPVFAYVGKQLGELLHMREDSATKLLRGYDIPDRPFPTPVPKRKEQEDEIDARLEKRFSLVTRGAYVGLYDDREARVIDLFRTEDEAREALEAMKQSLEAWESAPLWPSRKTKENTHE